jgi:hypothetical protein
MQIPKEQILEFLRSRGDSAQAERADRELPDQVDTEKQSGLLEKLGINLGELGGLGNLGDIGKKFGL